MAQWNLAERALYAKLVYYGPALGGKTTNLRALHALTDPEGRQRLVSVATADDRTLFFDLLPFELGTVLGYKVAIKLYTVPGQVRYNATRRVVLAGADAVVFVADSDPARASDNRQAWDNLKNNLRANGIDPASIPVVLQVNKRDVPAATEIAAMESSLGVRVTSALPAVATDGRGVVETFLAASRAMLERIVAVAEPSTKRSLDAGDLAAQMEKVFGPLVARSERATPDPSASISQPIVFGGGELLDDAVAAGARLAAELADAHGRASRLGREAEALRRLSDALRGSASSFDRAVVVDAALAAATETVGAAGAALLSLDAGGPPRIVGRFGRDLIVLAGTGPGGELVARIAAHEGPVTIDDLPAELPALDDAVRDFQAMAVVPVEAEPRTLLAVAMPGPDGAVSEQDVRFLATLAGHLAVGLERVRAHEELRRHRDRLEETVRDRTARLREAYDSLRSIDGMKDRFLSGASHEMRSPLTAIIGAATYLKDYDGSRGDRKEMAGGILHAAETLRKLVDGLLRVARLDSAADLQLAPAPPAEIVAEALALAHAGERVAVTIDSRVDEVQAHAPSLARAIGNLVENALKFGPASGSVELRVGPCMLSRSGAAMRGIAFAVLDRGPGIRESDLDRLFVRFEQGGDPLTSKPEGLGLGLYEARAIAARHGGTLVHLPRPGGGCEFRVSLPAAADARTALREAAGA